METNQKDDDDGGATGAKLIPEWSVAADDQVVLAGLAVVAAMALLLGWNAWRGGDDVPAPLERVAAAVQAGGPTTTVAAESGGAAVPLSVPEDAPTTTATTTTTVPASTTTVAAAPAIGDVQASVDSFPGDITGTNDDAEAILEGFVANQDESQAAEQAAAAVEGVTSVTNNLVILEPDTLDALRSAGVTGAEVEGTGTVMTIRGTIDGEEDRAPAVDAAAAIAGVTNVIDELELSVAADLNELPKVLFATNSAEILSESFGDLDAASELLMEAGTVEIEIQGYTDIEGDEDRNLRLSQARAEAVMAYLIGSGVEAEILQATGFGETEEFGPDFESNRLVRFQQIDR